MNTVTLIVSLLCFTFKSKAMPVDTMTLKTTYMDCLRPYSSDNSLLETCWLEVIDAYTDPRRYYHNLEHLQNFSNKLDLCKHKLKDYPTVFLAMIYHDIVYFMNDGSNESKSADIAALHLAKIGYPSYSISEVAELINATKTHALSKDADVNYFVDADMSILGSDATYYDQYAINIWREYNQSPQFAQGRKQVLQHFLTMDRIYKTDFFYQRYEHLARQNMEREIALLKV